MQKHCDIDIFGKVQGVAFRHHAQLKAKSLHLLGFARNESDGSVHIEVEGEESTLNQFIEWCRIGSPRSEVSRIELKTNTLKNFSDFLIY